MQIGIVGSGHIGSTVGTLWIKAGHDVMFSSRQPGTLQELVSSLGSQARAGTPNEAAAFGETVFFAIPFSAWPDLAKSLRTALAGKVVIDAANPYPDRDGLIAEKVKKSRRGSGAFVAGLIPASRVVKAFNTLYYVTLAKEANREGDRLAVPVAGSDAEAVNTVAGLVRDAGFEAVTLNSIDSARDFDVGTPVYNKPMSASSLRNWLGLQT